MNDTNQKQLGNTLWKIADDLRGAMDADDFRDYMLSFLFLRYLSDNYETAAKKELGKDYPDTKGDARKVPLALWYANNPDDIAAFEQQMRRKAHYVIQPPHLWNSIANMARTQNGELLNTLQAGFKYIEEESFESAFQGLFSEIDLASPKLGKLYPDRNANPEDIIKTIDWRTNAIFSVEGEPDSAATEKKLAALLRERGNQPDTHRFFIDADELIRANGRTYVVTKMWGTMTKTAMVKLLGKFPGHGISFKESV